MAQNITHQYDTENQIFFKSYFGEISLEDVIDSWTGLIREKTIPENTKRFIISYKDATILYEPRDAVFIANFYKKHDEIFAGSKVAAIMVTPDQTVFTHLLQLENVEFEIESFYTEEAARNWVLS
jgi:hypothetical protein